jgi:hypothetical protein
MRDLIRSLPVRSAFGLPVYVAASQAAPFSTEPVLSEVEGLGMTIRRSTSAVGRTVADCELSVGRWTLSVGRLLHHARNRCQTAGANFTRT